MDNRLIFLYHLVIVRVMGQRRRIGKCARMEVCAQAVRESGRQIRLTISSCYGEGKIVPKFLIPHCQENPLARLQVPVPQTDTGRRGENPKARERTPVKELGKMAP